MKARPLAIFLLFEVLALLAASCAKCIPMPLLVASPTATLPLAITHGDLYPLSTRAPIPSHTPANLQRGLIPHVPKVQ
jgi:hypothetical protein